MMKNYFKHYLTKFEKKYILKLLYNFLLRIVWICIEISSLFSNKLKDFVIRRKATMKSIKNNKILGSNVIWFHCSSLGEYEQSLPLIKKLKEKKSNYKIALTFFSSSAYGNKLEKHLCDWSGYLPFENSNKIDELTKFINPKLLVLIKNEFWPNLLDVLNQQKIPVISVSSRFNNKNFFFKPWASWFFKKIKTIKYFYTVDDKSKHILNKKGIKNSKCLGDTRMDRVYKLASKNHKNNIIEHFKKNKKCWIAGSTWEEDYDLITEYIENIKSPKVIIAPHDCSYSSISLIEKKLKIPCAKFSSYSYENDNLKKVLIIDSIGYLKYIYKYAIWAYVGGGMGKKGLHNILEPAVYGIPIIIGDNYKKFPEAADLINRGDCFSVSNKNEFNEIVKKLSIKSNYIKINPREYIMKNLGATNMIFNELELFLDD